VVNIYMSNDKIYIPNNMINKIISQLKDGNTFTMTKKEWTVIDSTTTINTYKIRMGDDNTPYIVYVTNDGRRQFLRSHK
jgi:hypothetical protein